jgi:hypothetical protein
MTIRTPDDEPSEPGTFWPPFKEGWTYQGATYSGHSNYSVDWNRRTPSGGWLDDRGDPVLAAADGTVKETIPADGYVLIKHAGGYATEYRHMQPVSVQPGQKVKRGDRIGSIGEAGNAPNGTHLHHVHYKAGQRIKMRFLGVPVIASVGDSDTQPTGWKPPAPVMVQGPPPPVTWEQSAKAAIKALDKAQAKVDSLTIANGALTEERDQARRELTAAQKAYQSAMDALAKANADLDACRAQGSDCHETMDRAIAAEKRVADAIAVLTR